MKKKFYYRMEKRQMGFILIAILVVLLVGVVYISISPGLIQPPTETTTTVATTQKTTTTTQTPVDTDKFQPSVVTLEIKSWGFNPDMVTLMKGSTATWTNKDSTKHTVTSAGNFDSGDIAAGAPWTYTFNKVGTFEYSCKYNPSMKAKVVITE